ncbi:NAD-dependent epimerase/dehydratase family protein [Streptomyces sp. I05A-00742]|uniref:NAD-dependent epimerase/dehydratase family protein n=1 Tax=Streptomyces sp. I05A-00742 TaxID=2732853 RepID=UPI001489BE09|nr:NAD-dependent epimerase/dehydratase family protein [Streptomyces sp. I05A-00742]
MRILVLGGTGFLGRTLVAQALARGRRVTTFNRGTHGPDHPGAAVVRGDRTRAADLRRLAASGPWDAVVDTSGMLPRDVLASARELEGAAGRYVFVSSLAALGWPRTAVTGDSPLRPCPPDAGLDDADFDTLKAGCERAVTGVFGPRSLIVRPGFLLGPHEDLGRLPRWLNRAARGGRILTPGPPARPLRFLDARDLARWLLDILEGPSAAGAFNVTGPPGQTTFGELLAHCLDAAGTVGAETVWADGEFLRAHDVRPWLGLPLWAAGGDGVRAVDTSRAEAAGLRTRPVGETVRDTWAWMTADGRAGRDYAAGVYALTPEREEALLRAWDTRPGEAGTRDADGLAAGAPEAEARDVRARPA